MELPDFMSETEVFATARVQEAREVVATVPEDSPAKAEAERLLEAYERFVDRRLEALRKEQTNG